MIHFIRPDWLWLLLPAFVYLLWVINSVRQKNPWKDICDAHLMPSLLQAGTYSSQRLLYTALFLFYSICILALAGPSWKREEVPVYREASSLMLVLDLSSAMNEVDIKPDRLTRAKYKIRDLINAGQNTQMGLVVFTQEAFTASPLSQDANTLNALLDELDPGMMPVSGSDSGVGLLEGYKLLKQAGAAHGNMLLVTASEPTANSLSAAKEIAEGGGHVNVLAMLDDSSNPTLVTSLKQLAQTGGGQYYFYSTDMQNMIGLLNNKQIMTSDRQENAYIWQDAGPWFCLLLLPLALLVLRENRRHEKY